MQTFLYCYFYNGSAPAALVKHKFVPCNAIPNSISFLLSLKFEYLASANEQIMCWYWCFCYIVRFLKCLYSLILVEYTRSYCGESVVKILIFISFLYCCLASYCSFSSFSTNSACTWYLVQVLCRSQALLFLHIWVQVQYV